MKAMERESGHMDTMGLCLNIQVEEVNNQITRLQEKMEKVKDKATYLVEQKENLLYLSKEIAKKADTLKEEAGKLNEKQKDI